MNVTVRQNLSPIKYCFLIKPNNKKSLLLSIKCSFSIWNGVYSPIIPYYSRLSNKYVQRYNLHGIAKDDYYSNILENFDPDVIILDDEIDSAEISKILNELPLIKLSDLEKQLDSWRPDFSMSIDLVINNLIESEFKFKRTDNLKIDIPKIKESHLLLNAWFGSVTKNIQKKYFENYLYKKDFVNEVDINYSNIDLMHQDYQISLLGANQFKTKTYYKYHWHKRQIVYFLNPSNFFDVIDFWNLRALGWVVYPIPERNISSNIYENLIINYLKDSVKRKHGVADFFFSKNVDDKNINSFLAKLIKGNKLKCKVSNQSWFPRFWSNDSEILNADFVYCPKYIFDNKIDDVEVEKNDFLNFTLPDLPFKTERSSSGYFKSYFSLKYFDNYELKYAELISDINNKDWESLIGFLGFRSKWKVSKQGVIRYINYPKERDYIKLPKAFDFFTRYFKNKGFTIRETASRKLGKEVLKNIGGLYGINVFSSESSIKLIELFENGKVVHMDTLIAFIKRYNPFPQIKNAHEIINLLIEKNIIEFGIKIQCAICEQHSFYLINDLNENLKCSVCRNNFPFPKSTPKSSLKYSYRGIGPFSRNNKADGLLSVFLTIRLFKSSLLDGFDQTSSIIFDFDIKNGEKEFEVDLAFYASRKKDKNSSDLFLCECKTFKNIEQKDIDRLLYLGQQMPNSILVIATLNNAFTDEEKALLITLVNHFRTKHGTTTNPVLLLTGEELIPNERYTTIEKYESKIPIHNHVNDMAFFADLTCEEHLGLKTCSEFFSEAWVKHHQKLDKLKSKK